MNIEYRSSPLQKNVPRKDDISTMNGEKNQSFIFTMSYEEIDRFVMRAWRRRNFTHLYKIRFL